MHQFQENFHYKLIYIFKIKDAAHRGLLKIGDATINTNKILPPNCAELKILNEVADIISWNIWQMDGLTFKFPFAKEAQDSLFNFSSDNQKIYCVVKDWQTGETFKYKELLKGGN